MVKLYPYHAKWLKNVAIVHNDGNRAIFYYIVFKKTPELNSVKKTSMS